MKNSVCQQLEVLWPFEVAGLTGAKIAANTILKTIKTEKRYEVISVASVKQFSC